MLERTEHGDILELRLARPPANALDAALIAALGEAIAAAPASGARALVLSGRPGMFSGGLDVPSLLTLDRAGMEQTLRDFFRLMRALAASPIPTVAAITGHAPAGGAVLSLFCDARVMAEGDFKVGLNEVQVGLSLPQVIHTALVRVVGERQAERLGVGGLLSRPGRRCASGWSTNWSRSKASSSARWNVAATSSNCRRAPWRRPGRSAGRPCGGVRPPAGHDLRTLRR